MLRRVSVSTHGLRSLSSRSCRAGERSRIIADGRPPDSASACMTGEKEAPVTQLYVHERYKGGSEQAETDEFNRHAERVAATQAGFAIKHNQPLRRAFHAKPHGC